MSGHAKLPQVAFTTSVPSGGQGGTGYDILLAGDDPGQQPPHPFPPQTRRSAWSTSALIELPLLTDPQAQTLGFDGSGQGLDRLSCRPFSPSVPTVQDPISTLRMTVTPLQAQVSKTAGILAVARMEGVESRIVAVLGLKSGICDAAGPAVPPSCTITPSIEGFAHGDFLKKTCGSAALLARLPHADQTC